MTFELSLDDLKDIPETAYITERLRDDEEARRQAIARNAMIERRRLAFAREFVAQLRNDPLRDHRDLVDMYGTDY